MQLVTRAGQRLVAALGRRCKRLHMFLFSLNYPLESLLERLRSRVVEQVQNEDD